MLRPPRPVREPILSARTLLTILFQGAVVGGAALAAFVVGWAEGGSDARAARSMAFCTLVCAELLMALAARSPTLTLGQLGFFSNPALLAAVVFSGVLQLGVVTLPVTRAVFQESGHSALEWLIILGLALVPVTIIETGKLLRGGVAGLSSGRPRESRRTGRRAGS
jgi:Ca2+-transporting ATPase